MKAMKFLLGAALAVTAVTGILATTTNASSSDNASVCKAARIGKWNSANKPDSSYTTTSDTATIHFKVTGAKDCKVTITMVGWKAPSLSGAPFEEQSIYTYKRQVFTPGDSYYMTLPLPDDCFYQIDTLTGESLYGEKVSHVYGDRQVGALHGGSKYCKDQPPVKVKVCNPATGLIIEVNQSEASKYKPVGDAACQPKVKVCNPATGEIITVSKADESKYKPITDAACQPKVPGKVNVCNPATGEIIVVDEDQVANYKPVDDAACVPATPETPPVAELPTTGIASTVLGVLSMGGLAASAFAWIQSRRSL